MFSLLHSCYCDSQLGDAILKLDDEVTKLIKVIGSALLKDATPDDLAIMSQQTAASGANGEAHSEFARLQRLPGYSRMKRQLFFNLMTARPDVSDSNIRIDHQGKIKPPKSTTAPANSSSSQHHPAPNYYSGASSNSTSGGQGGGPVDRSPRSKKLSVAVNSTSMAAPAAAAAAAATEDAGAGVLDDRIFAEDASLDRSTIKNISKLIYERDSLKSKMMAAEAAKKDH